MSKSYRGVKAKETDFYVTNKSVKLKNEIVCISKSEGKTYSQFIRENLLRIAATYPESARKYRDDDDGC